MAEAGNSHHTEYYAPSDSAKPTVEYYAPSGVGVGHAPAPAIQNSTQQQQQSAPGSNAVFDSEKIPVVAAGTAGAPPASSQPSRPVMPTDTAQPERRSGRPSLRAKVCIAVGILVGIAIILVILIPVIIAQKARARERADGGGSGNPQPSGFTQYTFGPPSTVSGATAGPSATSTGSGSGSGSGGGNDESLVTVALAASSGGAATTTITISTLATEAAAGAVVTVPIFHSSAFDPLTYESTLTYTAAQAGATRGLGVVDCPQANGTGYFVQSSSDANSGPGSIEAVPARMLFRKLCYSDVADASNTQSTIVASLDECIDYCATAGPSLCQAVAYGANISLAVPNQGANCWLKGVRGQPSAGDWQQSTATLLGFIVD